jgi:hypothetical protein
VIAILARPGDAAGYDLRLVTQLRALSPDTDIRREARADADVLLALVGPAWAKPPLDDKVVETVAKALATGRDVIPVLVQGGSMPPAQALPARIRAFSTINAATLHNDSFASGVQALLDRIRAGRGGGPWRDADVSGRIRIASVNPGLLMRAVSAFDSVQPVNVRIDGTVHGALHLFGDEMTVPVPPGRHEVLLRNQWEDPVQVDVPPNGTVVLNVARNVLSGAVRVKSTTRG